MGYIFILLAICSIIIVIAFPIMNAAKKRNQANMHLFDNMPEGKEHEKKHLNGSVMKYAFVAAIVYLIIFVICFLMISLVSGRKMI